jgi:hypothetical protein
MRYHCESYGPFLRHLADFVSACDFVQRLETLKCITSTRSSASDGQSSRNYSDLTRSRKCKTKRLALWPGEHLPVVHSAAQAQQLASFFNLGRSMTGF